MSLCETAFGSNIWVSMGSCLGNLFSKFLDELSSSMLGSLPNSDLLSFFLTSTKSAVSFPVMIDSPFCLILYTLESMPGIPLALEMSSWPSLSSFSSNG